MGAIKHKADNVSFAHWHVRWSAGKTLLVAVCIVLDELSHKIAKKQKNRSNEKIVFMTVLAWHQ